MCTFENKLVAVMNKSIESGVIMNALAHMSIAFGAKIGAEKLHLVDYIDKDGNTYPDISKMPFIILRENSNKIRTLYRQAVELNIPHSVFTNTMTEGGWEDQISRTKISHQEDLIFYGIILFGEYTQLNELTKKFSLWK